MTPQTSFGHHQQCDPSSTKSMMVLQYTHSVSHHSRYKQHDEDGSPPTLQENTPKADSPSTTPKVEYDHERDDKRGKDCKAGRAVTTLSIQHPPGGCWTLHPISSLGNTLRRRRRVRKYDTEGGGGVRMFYRPKVDCGSKVLRRE